MVVLIGVSYPPDVFANITIQVPLPDVVLEEYTRSSRPSPLTSIAHGVVGTDWAVLVSLPRPDVPF